MKKILIAALLCAALPLHAAKAKSDAGGGPILERNTTLAGNLTAHVTANTTDRGASASAIASAFTDIQRIAKLFNPNDASSDIAKVNAGAASAPVAVSPEVGRLIELAINVNEWTHGAFDITQTGDGRKVKYSKKNNTVQFKKDGIKINMDGILSGYLADILTQSLYNTGGQRNFMVTVDGVSRSIGQNTVGPWRMDISEDTGKYAQRGLSLAFSDLSVAIVGLGHDKPLVDPRNNSALTPQLKGVTLLGRDAADTQAIAWAMYVVGPKEAQYLATELQNLKFVIFDTTGNMLKSPGL